MGGSGCGKSTLLKHMIGLKAPAKGEILYHGESFSAAPPARQQEMVRSFGVTYQQGALWSSMTLAENIALPLSQYTDLNDREIRDLATLKLSLVGLRGLEDHFPSEISGGMRKRAALARAIALDPEILFFDEPSAGLDPISSKRLDDLILQIRDSLQATVIIVTHELPSLFSIVDVGVFLDVEKRTMTALGNPREMARNPPNANVAHFLSRGGEDPTVPGGGKNSQ
jgi:phospholipid/cholesterol/gamma-HCH transport system ATP-binding protein